MTNLSYKNVKKTDKRDGRSPKDSNSISSNHHYHNNNNNNNLNSNSDNNISNNKNSFYSLKWAFVGLTSNRKIVMILFFCWKSRFATTSGFSLKTFWCDDEAAKSGSMTSSASFRRKSFGRLSNGRHRESVKFMKIILPNQLTICHYWALYRFLGRWFVGRPIDCRPNDPEPDDSQASKASKHCWEKKTHLRASAGNKTESRWRGRKKR